MATKKVKKSSSAASSSSNASNETKKPSATPAAAAAPAAPAAPSVAELELDLLSSSKVLFCWLAVIVFSFMAFLGFFALYAMADSKGDSFARQTQFGQLAYSFLLKFPMMLPFFVNGPLIGILGFGKAIHKHRSATRALELVSKSNCTLVRHSRHQFHVTNARFSWDRSRVVQHVIVAVVTEHATLAAVSEHVALAVVTEHVILVVVTKLVADEDRVR
ncbi:hypothetical protein CYMTET_22769 [Cymbomonas tetramitiformis]|uniref:Uncharacterized protein n=1 Tax=Cymbomonas tetramitiformis TaxID=36881 RepID=A0AAE0L1Y4_9CHLO|nr:hypothetical protein CYMTET_22769 [Cymbomonas tetramitiformis]